MPTRGSDTGDGIGRKKTLRVSRRFEPLHLPFSTFEEALGRFAVTPSLN